MISGRASAIPVWLVTAAAAVADAQSADVDSLLASLVREPPQKIEFVEVRSSTLLERELVLKGMLEYRGRGKLSRTVSTPYVERTDIDGDAIRILRPNRPERSFSLGRAPGLGGFLTGLVAILGGDREALEREFELSLADGETGWQLKLVPRSKEVRARVESIRLRGSGAAPLCIVTVAKGGGSMTELLLGEAATNPEIARQRALYCGDSS